MLVYRTGSRRWGWLAAALVAILAAPAAAAEMASCADVRAYFRSPLPRDLPARIGTLRDAAELFRQRAAAGEACADWIVERGLFELARALDRHSRALDHDDRRSVAQASVDIYGRYLDWFVNLEAARQERLVRLLTRGPVDRDARSAARQRLSWLRARVGNALVGLGAALVRAGKAEEVPAAYASYARAGVQLFPDEAVRDWYKWLRAMPDFTRVHTAAELRILVGDHPEVAAEWELFRDFLPRYLQANPSIRSRWAPVMRRIDAWLRD